MNLKHIVIAAALLASFSSFAQKDELKALKKIYAKDKPSVTEMQEYKANVSKLQQMTITDPGDKVYADFYKAMLPILDVISAGEKPTMAQVAAIGAPKAIGELATALNATLDYEKKQGKKIYTDDILETIVNYKPQFVTFAINLGQQKMYKEAAAILYSVYLLDKTDPDKLYYAASYAVNGQDFDTALQYYDELKKLNYSGESTVYWAKNVATNAEESFPSKSLRDDSVKIKQYKDPRDEKLPSKRGEIYRNIALILVDKGKVEEAKTAIRDARISNPQDTSLIISEANLYLQSKDMATYQTLVKEALEKNPENSDLLYNLGVIAYNNKQYAEAEKYYAKSLQIDPKNANANLNMAILKLEPEDALIVEMNKLGTSAADNKKYEVLKKQRLDVFTSAIPYLESAVAATPDNYDAAKTLLNVYNALEMTDKAKALKVKVKEMEANGKK